MARRPYTVRVYSLVNSDLVSFDTVKRHWGGAGTHKGHTGHMGTRIVHGSLRRTGKRLLTQSARSADPDRRHAPKEGGGRGVSRDSRQVGRASRQINNVHDSCECIEEVYEEAKPQRGARDVRGVWRAPVCGARGESATGRDCASARYRRASNPDRLADRLTAVRAERGIPGNVSTGLRR